MSLGLTLDKLLVIGIIAVFLVGPDRLPHYAAQLARFVRWARSASSTAKERVRDEMGPEFDEIDWTKLDPRRYDPRRIVREALADESAELPRRTAAAVRRPGGRSGLPTKPSPVPERDA